MAAQRLVRLKLDLLVKEILLFVHLFVETEEYLCMRNVMMAIWRFKMDVLKLVRLRKDGNVLVNLLFVNQSVEI